MYEMWCRLKNGEDGIRTRGPAFDRSRLYQRRAFDHSATSPYTKTRYYRVPLDENVRASHSEALADYLQGGTEEAAWKCLVLQFADTI